MAKQSGLTGLVGRIQLKQDTDAKLTREAECTKEIDGIYTTKNTNQAEYDKQLLTLSSGFLALSLAFIKDIVHTDVAVHRWLLYSSFIVLSTCVFLVLASFQISNHGLEQAKRWYENRKEGDLETEFPYRAARIIDWCNIASGIIFFAGIVLAMSFVILNLQREANDGRTVDASSTSKQYSPQGTNHQSSGPSSPKPTTTKEIDHNEVKP